MSLDVRQMRHVIALHEHGGFARAASALGLSQSALSRSIRSVEREIGSSLFVRTASGAEPTDSGRIFIARIRQIVQLTENLDRDLVSERGLQSGHLHVGGGPYPAQSVLADALARFVADYPRIVVRVRMRDRDELLRRLRAREIELFVAEFSTFGSASDLDVEPLEPHPTCILARRGHPLAGQAPIGLADGSWCSARRTTSPCTTVSSGSPASHSPQPPHARAQSHAGQRVVHGPRDRYTFCEFCSPTCRCPRHGPSPESRK